MTYKRNRRHRLLVFSALLFPALLVAAAAGGVWTSQRGGQVGISTHVTARNARLVVSATSFVVPAMNLNMSLAAGLAPADLQYSAQLGRGGTVSDPVQWSSLSFTTKSLLALDPACTADEAPLGMILRYPQVPPTSPQLQEPRQVGRYYYAYAAPQAPCSENPAAVALEQSQIAQLERSYGTLNGGN